MRAHPDLAEQLAPSFGPVLAWGRGAMAALRRAGCPRARIHRVHGLDEAAVALEGHPFDLVVVDRGRLRAAGEHAQATLAFHADEHRVLVVDPVREQAPPRDEAFRHARREPALREPSGPLPSAADATAADEVETTEEPLGAFAEACLDHIGDVSALEHFVLATLAEQAGARRASLLTIHPHRRLLEGRAAIGFAEGIVQTWRVTLGHDLAGRVAERGHAIVGRGEPGGLRAYVGRTFVLLPLPQDGGPGGVVALTDLEVDEPPGEAAVARWAEIARRGGRALGVARRLQLAERLATFDPLTGLPNRRAYERALTRELSRAARVGDRVGLALVDIDHFTLVNNRYGHAAGDAVLRELALRLRRAFRDTDVVARWGGEEFALVLPSLAERAGPDDAKPLQRALDDVRRRPFRLPGGGSITVTFTAGLATYPEHGTTPEALFRAADRALYRGKEEGRNRIVIAD